jgi:hypothetical protein
VLDALDDAEHAPGQVIVDPRRLPGAPDERDDRERGVGLDVQRVADIAVRVTLALRGREHVRAGEVRAQRLGDQLGGAGPVGLDGDGFANGVNELGEGCGGGDGHALRETPRPEVCSLRFSAPP